MSGNYMFVMVAQGDTPIYEAEFLNTQRVRPRHSSSALAASASVLAEALSPSVPSPSSPTPSPLLHAASPPSSTPAALPPCRPAALPPRRLL